MKYENEHGDGGNNTLKRGSTLDVPAVSGTTSSKPVASLGSELNYPGYDYYVQRSWIKPENIPII